MKSLMVILLLGIFVGSAQASIQDDWTVTNVELGEVDLNHYSAAKFFFSSEEHSLCPMAEVESDSHKDMTIEDGIVQFLDPTGVVEIVNGVEIVLDRIERIGSRFYNLITAGAIDPCYKDKVVHVLPAGVTNQTVFQYVTGWKKPVAKEYQLTLESRNLPGRTVVEFRYLVVATYGGSVNGKGQYLANVHIIPADEPEVSIRWRFEAKVSTLTPVNVGPSNEEPIAGIEVSLDYVAKPFVFGATRIGTVGFFIDGEGNIDQIGQY